MKQALKIGDRVYWSPSMILETYGIHQQTFYKWVRRDLIPIPLKIGNRKYYLRDEVERRLSRGE